MANELRISSGKAILVAALGLSAAGCFAPVELPAPADPSRELPYVAASLAPATPGRQWLVLDTPGENAQVTKITGRVSTTDSHGNPIEGDATRDLCVTPCVTDLHLGAHTLLFNSTTDATHTDRLDVQLGESPLVLRHVVEQTVPFPSGAVGLDVWGSIFLGTGVIMTPIGVQHGTSGLEIAGGLGIGVGALMVAGGIVYAYVKRGTHIPGATTTWTIPRSGATTSAAGAPGGAVPLVRF
jgi:hypothetical protein